MSSKKGSKKAGSDASASVTTAAANGKPTAAVNAWAKPLKTKGPPPGMGPADSKNVPSSKWGASQAHVNRERMLHLSLSMVGQKVVLTQTNGSVLEGVFQTFTPFSGLPDDRRNKYVLGAVKVIKKAEKDDQAIKDGATVVVPVEKVVQVHAKKIQLDRPTDNGNSKLNGGSDVITDTQISGAGGNRSRDLVAAGSAWMTGNNAKTASALGDDKGKSGGMTRKGFGTATPAGPGGLQGSIGQWDQFKANEELFNVNASFDENLYTTELDKTQIDARQVAKAERLAREIEKTTSSNIHVAEERGHAVETDYDEEDRYSGVLTKDGKQRHELAQKKAPTKMNYAAAAAKADAGKKAASAAAAKGEQENAQSKDGDAQAKKDTTKADGQGSKDASAKKEKPDAKSSEMGKDAGGDKEKSKSKLNPKAKSFSFNPTAKSFTPSFGGATSTSSYPAQPQPPQHLDNMHMHAGGHHMPPQFVPPQMGQPGMVPMMNPPYAGVRYPNQFPHMDPNMHGTGGQPNGQQPQPAAGQGSGDPAATTSNGAPPDGEAGQQSQEQQDGDSSQPTAAQVPQQSRQPPQVPMPYPPQPGVYYPGGVPMPRGPAFPPQFAGVPPQMSQGPYRHMYTMQPGMPPNMHMPRPGAPYYPGPGGPMGYPPSYHGMMEDGGGDPNFRGGRGRGTGRGGRGRRNNGRGRGGGGRNYHNNNNNNGRSTPQQQQQGQQQQQQQGDTNGGTEATSQDKSAGPKPSEASGAN